MGERRKNGRSPKVAAIAGRGGVVSIRNGDALAQHIYFFWLWQIDRGVVAHRPFGKPDNMIAGDLPIAAAAIAAPDETCPTAQPVVGVCGSEGQGQVDIETAGEFV